MRHQSSSLVLKLYPKHKRRRNLSVFLAKTKRAETRITVDSMALPPMHDAREGGFACVADGRCVLVAGGNFEGSVEVYEEALGRWRQLPRSLPDGAGAAWMGTALV